MRHSPSVLIALLVLSPLTMARAQSISGTVRELSRRPLAKVSVSAVDAKSKKQVHATSDTTGAFLIGKVPTGSFNLLVEKDGKSWSVGPYTIGLKERLQVDLVMHEDTASPFVHVTSNRLENLRAAGFYDRMETVHGEFLVREDIEATGASTLSRILSNMRGVRLVNGSGGKDVVMRASVGSNDFGPDAAAAPRTLDPTMSTTSCHPPIFVNGALVRRSSSGEPQQVLDEIDSPDNIDAIEVYQGTDLPPQFTGPNEVCGAIVLWRRPGRG